jgi:hypothetical protein
MDLGVHLEVLSAPGSGATWKSRLRLSVEAIWKSRLRLDLESTRWSCLRLDLGVTF